ncbi:hypothetical protein SPV1_06409, partial [Mariprofundus ferrooxydans PV-1]
MPIDDKDLPEGWTQQDWDRAFGTRDAEVDPFKPTLEELNTLTKTGSKPV